MRCSGTLFWYLETSNCTEKSVVSPDAAVYLHSALLGCPEVWLPMDIGQCPSASVCTYAECWLPSHHTEVLQSDRSPDPLLEKRHTGKETVRFCKHEWPEARTVAGISCCLWRMALKSGRLIFRSVSKRIQSLLLDYRGGTSYHLSFSMQRDISICCFFLPRLKSLEVCSPRGSALNRVGSASVLHVLSKSIPPTLVGKDRTSLRGIHDISRPAQMQWRWCLKRH